MTVKQTTPRSVTPPVVRDPDLQAVLDWAQSMFTDVESTRTESRELELRERFAAPEHPREGMIVYADGTSWNPGQGEGAYIYKNGAWCRLMDFCTYGDSLVKTGTIVPYADETPTPSGYLLCDGAAVSRTTYADLFALLGTVFGAGDGSTTFNVPDLRGRVIAGTDDMGGTSANRLTAPAGNTGQTLNGDTFGAAGGSETYALVEANLASHTHGMQNHTHTMAHTHFTVESGANTTSPLTSTEPISESGNPGTNNDYTLTGDAGTADVGITSGSSAANTGTPSNNTTTAAGSGTAHTNVQPTLILHYMIKT